MILNYNEFLNEKYLDDIISDMDSARYDRSQDVIVEFYSSDFAKKTATFFVRDEKRGSGKSWKVMLKFDDYKSISKQKKLSKLEKLKMSIEAGDIRVNCGCPDFLYKGYKYMGYEKDYGIYKEVRFPKIKNPDLEGSVCKHVNGVLEHIDKYYDDIAKGFEKTKE